MSEQSELQLENGSEHEIAPPCEDTVPTVKCVFCGDYMVRDRLPRFNRVFGIGLLVLGIVISAFVSLVVGLPLVAFGAYMGRANRSVWVCRLCAAMVDRNGN